MVDRIAEIREAYDEALADWNGEIDGARPESFALVFEMARDHIALLDSDALIIRRDEAEHSVRTNPEQWTRWPTWALDILIKWGASEAADYHPHDILDALASSQGVEPQLEEQQ